MLIAAVYFLEDSGDEWSYQLQYCGKMFDVNVPEPWQNLALGEREDMMNALFGQAFTHFRDRAIMTRPSDAADECMEQAINKDIREGVLDDEEEDDEESAEDLSDVSLEDLKAEIERRKKELEE